MVIFVFKAEVQDPVQHPTNIIKPGKSERCIKVELTEIIYSQGFAIC